VQVARRDHSSSAIIICAAQNDDGFAKKNPLSKSPRQFCQAATCILHHRDQFDANFLGHETIFQL
jgi:hypothetical protein